MKSLLLLALILSASQVQSLAASRAETLVETLRMTAQPDSAMTDQEQSIAKKVQAIGPDAIPFLLRLLQDNDDEVRSLAAYTLQDFKGLTDAHLDALIDSGMGSDSFIARAIAHIGTPRAVTFLVEELGRERPRTTDWALDEAMKTVGGKAVPELLKMAADETAPSAKRRRAIGAIGTIGLAAEKTAPDLVRLKATGDEIGDAVDAALVNLRATEAVPILLKRLEEIIDQVSRMFTLRDISGLKAHGKSAGPSVEKYLTAENWDIRIEAAFTLGCIGYAEATDDLIKLLNNREDWRLAFASAKSLQLLKAERALPALSQASKEHWYPPVRAAAAAAVRTIRSGTAKKNENPDGLPPPEYFEYGHTGGKMGSFDYDEIKSLRFPVATDQYQPVKVIVQEPDKAAREERWLGVPVAGGYVAGSDHGEWGGKIGFIDATGRAQVIANDNTEAIYQTAHGIFAVTGLAHLSMNHGAIFKLNKGADGVWTAEKWRALPGAPRCSRLLVDGRIIVSCHYGGIVLVSPDGSMKSLTRHDALESAAARR